VVCLNVSCKLQLVQVAVCLLQLLNAANNWLVSKAYNAANIQATTNACITALQGAVNLTDRPFSSATYRRVNKALPAN